MVLRGPRRGTVELVPFQGGGSRGTRQALECLWYGALHVLESSLPMLSRCSGPCAYKHMAWELHRPLILESLSRATRDASRGGTVEVFSPGLFATKRTVQAPLRGPVSASIPVPRRDTRVSAQARSAACTPQHKACACVHPSTVQTTTRGTRTVLGCITLDLACLPSQPWVLRAK